jgi:ADP-ribose pyrophosphatase
MFKINDVVKKDQVVATKLVYKGKLINVRIDEIILKNGTKYSREIVEHPGAVTVLAFLNNDTVLMVRQYRRAADKVLLELPAGTLNNNETPEECALRELEEETGYRAHKIEKLGSFYLAPGYSTEKIHAFFASELEEKKQKLEIDEDIKVEKVRIKDLLVMINDGKIEDAKTLASLFLFLNRGNLVKD